MTIAPFKKRYHPLYDTHKAMLHRCYSTNNPNYSIYGAHGIKVHSSWRGDNGFYQFVHDMGIKPPHYTLDRIDNNKWYSPINCRWASIHEQAGNMSTNSQVVGVRIRVRTHYIAYEANIKLNGVRYSKTFTTMEEAITHRHSLEILHLGKQIT
jgi:hypothetical protein